MDWELERLRREKDKIMENLNAQLENYTQIIEDHLTQVRDEYLRVAKFSGQAGYVMDKINRDFKKEPRKVCVKGKKTSPGKALCSSQTRQTCKYVLLTAYECLLLETL